MTGETKTPLPVWYKPILSKEERATPMLLCRKPEPLKSFSRKRVQQLATPKVMPQSQLTLTPSHSFRKTTCAIKHARPHSSAGAIKSPSGR